MISTIDRISSSINQHQQPTSIINRMASSTDWHHQLTSFPIWQGSSTNWPHQPTSIINRPVSITIPISTIWLAEIVEVKQQYINVGVQLHLKVIDDSLPKQGKANQGKGLFCTSSRTNEVPFIAHELVQHLPTAQCSFSKHEHDSPTRGDREVRCQCWCQSVDDASQLMMLVGWFMMPVGWWCRSVNDAGQLMMHVSWWCRLVGYAGWLKMMFSWWCWSFNDASQLMMVVWWCWSVDKHS